MCRKLRWENGGVSTREVGRKTCRKLTLRRLPLTRAPRRPKRFHPISIPLAYLVPLPLGLLLQFPPLPPAIEHQRIKSAHPLPPHPSTPKAHPLLHPPPLSLLLLLIAHRIKHKHVPQLPPLRPRSATCPAPVHMFRLRKGSGERVEVHGGGEGVPVLVGGGGEVILGVGVGVGVVGGGGKWRGARRQG